MTFKKYLLLVVLFLTLITRGDVKQNHLTTENGVKQADNSIQTSGYLIDKTFAKEGIMNGFIEPKMMTLDKKGNIYIFDKGINLLYKIPSNGKKKRRMKQLDKKAHCITALNMDKSNHLWYAQNHGIIGDRGIVGSYSSSSRYDPLDPKVTYWPSSFAFGSNNKIYIRNAGSHGLRVYNHKKVQKRKKRKKRVNGFMYGDSQDSLLHGHLGGSSLATDGKGNIWASSHSHQIRKVFDNGKKLTFKYYVGGRGSGLGNLNSPMGISFDGKNSLYVADSGNDRIQKFIDNGASMKAAWILKVEEGKYGHPIDVYVRGNTLFVLTKGDSSMNNAALIKYKQEKR